MHLKPLGSQRDFGSGDKKRQDRTLALVAEFVRLRAFGTEQQTSHFITDEKQKVGAAGTAQTRTIEALDGLFSAPLPESIELGSYLEQICSAMQPLVSSAGAAKLVCECDPDCEVRNAARVLVGLIVCEIILNAARHAHPSGVAGRIDVGCRRTGEEVFVEVADDGIGLPSGFNAGRGGSLGFEMVRALAKQLNATPLFESHELGLQFLLKLPQPGGHHGL